MWILIISLLVLVMLTAAAGTIRNIQLKRKLERGEIDALPAVKKVDMECCGQHEVCEKESLLAAVSKEIEYYDDEELDRFAGMPSEVYTSEQEEEFRDILYSMHETEVAGWVRSLQLRNIALPDGVKDEVFLVIGERRNNDH